MYGIIHAPALFVPSGKGRGEHSKPVIYLGHIRASFIQKRGEAVENYERAEQDYMAGMKYKEIAKKYDTTVNTVKSWKNRYGWSRKEGAHKEEKVCTQNEKVCTQKNRVQKQRRQQAAGANAPPGEWTAETLGNGELSDRQQMFCIYYSRSFNAAQSYQKAYGCSYESALCAGPRLLGNVRVHEEVERLKEMKRQQILVSEEDIVELQMRIALGDIGDVLQFGQEEVKTKDGDTIKVNNIRLKESTQVDTQLIQSVTEIKGSPSVVMKDPQKAINWLTKYFLMHPDDKYKAEFDRRRAEIKDNAGEQILKNMQTIAEILTHPVPNRDISTLEEEKAEEAQNLPEETAERKLNLPEEPKEAGDKAQNLLEEPQEDKADE